MMKKGQIHSGSFKKGHLAWNKNRKETRLDVLKKLSLSKIGNKYGLGNKSRIGQTNSPESNKKRSKFMMGRKHGLGSKSRTGWTNSKEAKQKSSEKQKGRKKPEEFRKNLIEYYSTPEGRRLQREKRAKQIFPKKDTSIELKIQNYLRQLGITFATHKRMEIKYAYPCDIFIPVMNLIIECDGDYWHCNTKIYDFRKMKQSIKEQVQLDFERTAQLEEQGYRVIRLWGSEINKMTIEEFKQRIESAR